jgi:four helix bundle protein
MAKINQYEELEVWQMGMNLCQEVYAFSNKSDLAKDFSLRDQIRRSSISIPSNIAEGFERGSDKQFIYFLVFSKGSCGELRTQINLANRLKYITDDEYEILNKTCLSVSKQLSGFINYLKTRKPKPKNI